VINSASRIDDITPADQPWVLALNQRHICETSHLDAESLRALLAAAFQATVARPDAGFLIAFDQDAQYTSENFLWFCARYASFVYVDRIISDAQYRGQGLAKLFYENLFASARQAGHTLICCEVNINPPNVASDKFHAALGFVEAGRADFPDKEKSVRYLTCAL
jgi:uncharacterized protein